MSTATPGWHSDVSGISYPLVSDLDPVTGPVAARFPRSVLMDAIFVLGPGVEFDNGGTDQVLVTEVENLGTGFRLQVTVRGVADTVLEFTLPASGAGVVTGEQAESSSCSGDWVESWVTVHAPEALLAIVPAPADIATCELRFEPSTVRLTAGSFVTGITFANTDRTRAPDIGDSNPDTPRPTRVWQPCVQGPIMFREGYNARIRVDPNNNTLLLGAGLGHGEGQACSEIPTYPGELPDPITHTLDGAVSCSMVLRALNGAPGPDLQFEAGPGINISTDPANHTITIEADV